MYSYLYLIIISILSINSCDNYSKKKVFNNSLNQNKMMDMTNNMGTAVFGGGCFWCVEAVFQRIKGVESVVSGYSGGNTHNPTYKDVSTGETGHAEVVKITFNPQIITYNELLEIFWKTHDPTTLNRQGADVGTQYRSVIFYINEEQKKLAEEFKEYLNKENVFGKPVVTEIFPLKEFYKAEDYHQNYYNNNKYQPYCSFIITPKIDKLIKNFKSKIKSE